MYARCPSCHTLFRITPRQLKVARGQVRCGECQITFDAIDSLVNHEELSKNEQRAAARIEGSEARQWPLPFDGEPVAAASQEHRETLADEAPASPIDTPRADTVEATGDMAVMAEQLVQESPPSALDEEESVAPLSEPDVAPAPLSSPAVEPPAPSPEQEPSPAAAQEELAAAPQEAAAEATPPQPSPFLPVEVPATTSAQTSPPAAEEGLVTTPDSAEETITPRQPRYALPEEPSKPRRSVLAWFGWSIASLLLVALLAAQLALLNRATLALYPAATPWLERLCRIAPCREPARRDLKAIEMTERTVLSHPDFESSLLITATLLNKASFAQPYPAVELTMTDLEQKPVASRRFLPDEYLSGADPDGVFAPGAVIRLRLEIADPGDEAVGFEFNFY